MESVMPYYNVFSKISSIKDKLKSYSITPDELCHLCYNYYSVDESNLCSGCKTEYTKDNIICLIQSIISKTYRHDKNETDNIINLFRNYIKDPYEKLLLEYFSCNIFDYGLNHFDCKHDKTHNLFCDHILDLISRVSNINQEMYLAKCQPIYIELLVKKGADLNSAIKFAVECYLIKDAKCIGRINKFIELGASKNVNISTGFRKIINRDEKITALKNIGLVIKKD